jgi:hypothetical protein
MATHPGLMFPRPAARLQRPDGLELQAVMAKLYSAPPSFPLRFVGVYTDGGIDSM